jgi:hypothetical protein
MDGLSFQNIYINLPQILEVNTQRGLFNHTFQRTR